MKKNALTTAVVAGIVGVAGIVSNSNAISMSGSGLGGALVYPYYTVNDGNSTILSVVNTTENAKAIKVAFREGLDSRDIFDFNLYMSAYDVWTAAVFSLSGEGPALIQTFDNSCTVPNIKNPPIGLNPVTVPGGTRAVPMTRNVSISPALTREGYFTMVEMGILAPGTLSEALATHVGGEPAGCGALVEAWQNGLPAARSYWVASNGLADMAAPTGGLGGFAAVVDVANGVMYAYGADAIQRFSDSIQHRNPELEVPAITNPVQVGLGGQIESVTIDNAGRPITSRWTIAPQAIGAVFMSERVINEYVIDNTAADAFDSEWVLTFPTKRPHVAGGPPAIPPFRTAISNGVPGTACEVYQVFVYDREENVYDVGGGVSPRPDARICREVQVIAFGDDAGGTSDILGAPAAAAGALANGGGHININNQVALGPVVLDPAFTAGWASLSFRSIAGGVLGNSPSMTSADGDTYFGLPVTGFWALAANNTQGLPGVRAFYGAFVKHKQDRTVTCAAAGCIP
jgi:hypothetical protein